MNHDEPHLGRHLITRHVWVVVRPLSSSAIRTSTTFERTRLRLPIFPEKNLGAPSRPSIDSKGDNVVGAVTRSDLPDDCPEVPISEIIQSREALCPTSPGSSSRLRVRVHHWRYRARLRLARPRAAALLICGVGVARARCWRRLIDPVPASTTRLRILLAGINRGGLS